MNILEAIETRRSIKHYDPAHVMPEADVERLMELARLAPELNPSNYDHDDVCRLNAAMCELYEVVRKYRPEANDKAQFER
jgi:hypothetical protein